MKNNVKISKEEEEVINIFIPLYRNWKWIIIGSVLTGILALVFGLLKPQYSAKAIIAIDRNALYSDNLNIPSDALIRDIVTSDQVLMSLIQNLDKSSDVVSIESLRDGMELAYTDFSLVLTITDDDPDRAVKLVNQWAAVVSDELRFLISPSENVVDAFRSNEEQSMIDWNLAQEEFLLFQDQSDYNVLKTRLLSAEQLLYKLTLAEAKLVQAQQDSITLIDSELENNYVSPSSQNEIILLLLTTNSLVSSNLNWAGSDSDNIQFDLNFNNQVEGLSTSDLINDLQALEGSIDNRRVMLTTLIRNLEDDIQSINEEMQSVVEEETRLTVAKDIALEQYKKSKEELIGINVAKLHADESVWISSQAVEGFESSLSPAVMFGIGFMLGGIAVVTYIYGKELWMKLNLLSNQ